MINREQYHRWKQEVWLPSLKVGDIVNDCRNKNLAVTEIRFEYRVTMPRWLRRILLWERFPIWVYEKADSLFYRLGFRKLTDAELVLEDGAYCSVMHCCDPVEYPKEFL